jgi:hypothetical protein
MSRPRRARLAATLALLAGCALANTPDGPSTVASVSIGADVSNTDSRRLYATGDFDVAKDWSVNAGLARSDLDLPGESTQSTLASAGVGHRLGAFTVGGGFRHGEIDGVSRTNDWLVRGSWRNDAARLGLEVGRRDATLAPSAFTEDLGGEIGVVSGVSHCDVDGIGYRASVDLDRPTWSGFASLRVFDYDDFDCTLDIASAGGPSPPGPPAHGPPPHARGRALGRRLAGATLDEVIGATSRLVPHDAALLKSSASIGFTTPVSSTWIGGLEIDRDVEQLDGGEYLTAIVSASRLLTSDWTLELSLGYSLADAVDDSAFAGVRFVTYFRR